MPYRIHLVIDSPEFSLDPVKSAQVAFDIMESMQEAAAKLDGDIQDGDVEWYGSDSDPSHEGDGVWTYADEELLREAMWTTDDQEILTVQAVRRLRSEADDDAHFERLRKEFASRIAKQQADELEDRPDPRSLVNQAIGCIGAIHSMVYNPDDKRPVEPKLAELEKLLRAIRL